LPGETTVP